MAQVTIRVDLLVIGTVSAKKSSQTSARRSTGYGQPTGSKVGTAKSEECCAALKNSWKAIASPRRTMSHNMDHNQYRFEGSSIERVNQKPFTSLNQNPCDQYDHQKPVANAVGKNGAWYDRSNSYMGDSSERNVLPLLPDAEECMELVSSGRLIGTALQRFHQGKLRLPTRRRARLLKLELKLTLLFVLLFLGIAWPAYPHGGGLLSQQPQARRLPLSPGAAC